MMSDSIQLDLAPGMKKSSPEGYAHRSLMSATEWFETLLHIKGFGGGVPLNTETAAVNPRVGI